MGRGIPIPTFPGENGQRYRIFRTASFLWSNFGFEEEKVCSKKFAVVAPSASRSCVATPSRRPEKMQKTVIANAQKRRWAIW